MNRKLPTDTGVGIDALNVYASTLCVDLGTLATSRGYPAALLLDQGMLARSMPPAFEDAVTMTVNAAKPLVEEYGRDAFELLIVATESGFDYGKATSNYVHKYLGLHERCRNFELKLACYAGTAALHMAAAWVHQTGKKALVVMADARRSQLSSLDGVPFRADAMILAEGSGGAGAVAMVVAPKPRILELKSFSGYVSREIYDVSRPTAQLEQGDPALSLSAYLDLLEAAYGQVFEATGLAPGRGLDYVAYHTPVPALVKQAHEVVVSTASEEFPEAAAVAASFERHVAPSLAYARRIGNSYSASVYVALAGLLDHAPQDPAGATIGLFSYGSGSCAEFYLGTIGPEARRLHRARGLEAHLARRRQLPIDEYDRVRLAADALSVQRDGRPVVTDQADLARYAEHGWLVLDEVANYYRRYRWA